MGAHSAAALGAGADEDTESSASDMSIKSIEHLCFGGIVDPVLDTIRRQKMEYTEAFKNFRSRHNTHRANYGATPCDPLDINRNATASLINT